MSSSIKVLLRASGLDAVRSTVLTYSPTLPYLRGTPFQGERFSLVWFSPAEEMEDGGDLGDRYALPSN